MISELPSISVFRPRKSSRCRSFTTRGRSLRPPGRIFRGGGLLPGERIQKLLTNRGFATAGGDFMSCQVRHIKYVRRPFAKGDDMRGADIQIQSREDIGDRIEQAGAVAAR